jgi:hypothetical protein
MIEDTNILKTVLDYWVDTNHLYQININPNIRSWPIPFFGNVDSAKVITVGVNPAESEFYETRNWPSKLTYKELGERIINYFKLEFPRYHSWFEPWEEALNILGYSYKDGSAAHLDLSPRATIPMSKAPDPILFEEMIRKDMQIFFNVLQECHLAKILLIAGTVTNRYFDNFLKSNSLTYGFRLYHKSSDKYQTTRFTYHKLFNNKYSIPVFFVGASPSSWGNGPQKLKKIIEHNRIKIHDLIDLQNSDRATTF